MKQSPTPSFAKLVSQGLLTAAIGIVGAAVLATLPVPAIGATEAAAASPQARAQYARDVAHCRSLTPRSTERANCLSEASTRFHMKLPSKATESPDILARNALRRCDPLPPADKTECVARMQYGSATGSIAGGGVLRSLTTREPVTDPAALPPTAAGPASQPPMPPVPPAVLPPAPTPMAPAAPAPTVPQPVPPSTQPAPPMQPGS